jgi:hypothetical protein
VRIQPSWLATEEGSMGRFISPSLHALDALVPPLQAGEREVVSFFNRELPEEWEIYVQPHLNGMRPDVVLLNPRIGIAVFEVKDWDLSRCDYRPASGGDDASVVVQLADGTLRQTRTPLTQVKQYRKELAELYCPSLPPDGALKVITAGVIFTRGTTEQARSLLCHEQHDAQLEPVVGSDALRRGRLAEVFPMMRRAPARAMPQQVADDLRSWLREPRSSSDRRVPVVLDANQRRLVSGRTAGGYRRLRGPAGCGKSIVVAARAAALSNEGKSVLVVTFNHTLRNYLRGQVGRFSADANRITWLGFHDWCRRTMQQAGHAREYSQLWKPHSRRHALEDGIAKATINAIEHGSTRVDVDRYDAILIDEGQDFRLEWWNALRRVLASGGEMLLVADRAQDIYDRHAAWTEEAMQGAGFSGPWNELTVSYRCPPQLLRLLRLYREERLPKNDEVVPLPASNPQDELALLDLRWRQVDGSHLLPALLEEVDAIFGTWRSFAVSDLCICVDSDALGLSLRDALEQRNIGVLTTIDSNRRAEKRLKYAFFNDTGRVKLTTIQSFKGWEAPLLLVGMQSAKPQLTYTALSRLRRDDGGSRLTVVCADPGHATFGRQWPSFRDDTRAAA